MFTQITLLGKDNTKQVIHLSDKFGIEEKHGKKQMMSPEKQQEIAQNIGHDILKGNLFSANLS